MKFKTKVVLAGLDLTLEPKRRYALIGPSGGGKSTLLKLIGGLISREAYTGSLTTLPQDKIGLMFQEGGLFDSLNLLDNTAFPVVAGDVPIARLSSESAKVIIARVSAILGRVGLGEALNKFPGQLSGGMRKRAALARAVIGAPELALLDDPTAGLDPVASSVIMNLIVSLQKEAGSTFLIAGHDLRRLLPVVDSVIALFHGRVVFMGAMDRLKNEAPKEVLEFVSGRFSL